MGWRNLVRVSLIFAIIVSFMLLFRRISDSRFTWVHDFEENLTESVGPVPCSAQYLICRHVQTDRQTDRQTDGRMDELIRVGLGNLQFLQVNRGSGSGALTQCCCSASKNNTWLGMEETLQLQDNMSRIAQAQQLNNQQTCMHKHINSCVIIHIFCPPLPHTQG